MTSAALDFAKSRDAVFDKVWSQLEKLVPEGLQ